MLSTPFFVAQRSPTAAEGIVAHTAIASDQSGNVYSVSYTGELHRNTLTPSAGRLSQPGPGAPVPEPSQGVLTPGLGEGVGTGWQGVTHIVAVPVNKLTCLLGIGPDGSVIGSASPATPAAGVTFPAPVPVPGIGPGARTLIGGESNNLFVVRQDGSLTTQPLTVSGSAVQAGTPTVLEPSGWSSGLATFVNGDGLFFDVTPGGTLRYQKPDASGPRSANWKSLDTGWTRSHAVFGGGPGRIYAIGSEGSVELRRYATDGGAPAIQPRTRASIVGSGLFPWTGCAADIEGYVWPMSVAPGGTVHAHVGVRLSAPPAGIPTNVADPVYYTANVRRLRRWHNGTEADFDDVKDKVNGGDRQQAKRYQVPKDLLDNGAGWEASLTIKVGSDWETGVYAVQLTDTSGRNFYAPFIVRPFALLSNTNTWNAYNNWGGRGKYTHTYPLPDTLPFKRPHPGLTAEPFLMAPNAAFNPFGLSVLTNSCHLLRAELWVQGWLEDLGPRYACDHYTDQDLHDGKTAIGDGAKPAYKGVILSTHPEYWTVKMYDRLKAYRDQGGSIIYLGGNGIYEAVELSADGEHMAIFNGVDLAAFPPYCTNEQLRLNCLMRAPINSRPEHALLGVGFQNCAQGDAGGQPYNLQQVPNAIGSNPVLKGVTIGLNDQLGAASHDVEAAWQTSPAGGYHADGWEVDQRGAGTPPPAFENAALIAMGNTNPSISGEMLCYTTAHGGLVFAAASINFGASMIVDPNMQRIVQNALDLCLAR
jgi:hypothetical protein